MFYPLLLLGIAVQDIGFDVMFIYYHIKAFHTGKKKEKEKTLLTSDFTFFVGQGSIYCMFTRVK